MNALLDAVHYDRWILHVLLLLPLLAMPLVFIVFTVLGGLLEAEATP